MHEIQMPAFRGHLNVAFHQHDTPLLTIYFLILASRFGSFKLLIYLPVFPSLDDDSENREMQAVADGRGGVT